ncbi:MAG TPA: hypothetical protein VLA87_02780 [Gaiellaceae bacterium]|nr:hypothetical protein [Gaiellaceae bacterium]
MRRIYALVAGTLLALSLAGPAQATGVPRLLTKFQPVLVFHPGEELRPTAVESFVRDSNLEAATSPTTWIVVNPSPTADGLPATSPPVWRLNQRDCFAGAPLGDLACYVAGAADEPGVTVYGRVTRDDKRIVLQYWLFYYDNLYRYPFLPPGAIWQSHEGDWEVVTVVLSKTRRPLSVGLSAHCSGETLPWSETELRKGHPTVYVALGSHANYFEPGQHPFDPACLPAQVIAFFEQAGLPLPADVAADGPAAGPARPGVEPADIERVSDDSPSWIAFPGFWGELQYFNAPPPVGTQVFGTSPVGPAFHAVWQEPLATLESWH